MEARDCPTCEQTLPITRFGTKGHHRSGHVRYQRHCLDCTATLNNARKAALKLLPPDPLGADPLMPLEPFRAWLERVIARRVRVQGFAIPCRENRGLQQQSGAIEAIGAELAARLGGSSHTWCRKIYRWRFEGERIRLSAADELLLALDFDGTTLDDLWPLDEDEVAAPAGPLDEEQAA